MGIGYLGGRGAAIAALLTAFSAHADFTLGSERWDYDVRGFVNDRGERLDFRDDLDVHAERDAGFSASVGELGGFWPDLQIDHTKLGGDGHRETEEQTLLGIIVLRPGTEIVTRARFDETGATAYWPIRLGRWRVSPGVALKHLQGAVVITENSSENRSRQPYDEWFPQLHLGLGWQPFDRLTLQGTFQGVSYQKNAAREWRATAELRLLGKLHLRGGWQEKRYDIRLPDYQLDATLDGPVVGALLRF